MRRECQCNPCAGRRVTFKNLQSALISLTYMHENILITDDQEHLAMGQNLLVFYYRLLVSTYCYIVWFYFDLKPCARLVDDTIFTICTNPCCSIVSQIWCIASTGLTQNVSKPNGTSGRTKGTFNMSRVYLWSSLHIMSCWVPIHLEPLFVSNSVNPLLSSYHHHICCSVRLLFLPLNEWVDIYLLILVFHFGHFQPGKLTGVSRNYVFNFTGTQPPPLATSAPLWPVCCVNGCDCSIRFF